MNRSEREAKDFQIFINHYKYKTTQEIIESTLEISASRISKFEHLILDAYRTSNFNQLSLDRLLDVKRVLNGLIDAESPAIEDLRKKLDSVSEAISNQ